MSRHLDNLVKALQARQHVDERKVRLHGRASQIVKTTHLGQCPFKILLLGVKAADLVLSKVERVGSAQDAHRAIFLHYRQHHTHQLVVAKLRLDRTRCQKLGNGALSLQLLNKTGEALKRACTVNFCLLAQLDDARHIRVIVHLHDLELISRIGKQQVAQRRRQRTVVVTRASVNLCRLNRIRRVRLICLKHALARHIVHIHALKILGDRHAIGQIGRTPKGICCNDALALLAVGSRNLNIAARNAGTCGKTRRCQRKRHARVVLRGPNRTRVLVQLAPDVILSVVFTLRHGIHDRAPKPNEHNPLGNVCPIGIVEPCDHVKCLDNTREAAAHIPLTARPASYRSRFAPRVIARGRIEQSGNIVGRLGDMPRVKERAALKTRRGCRWDQSGPNALKDAGEAVETALDSKQHVNLILVQQATIKIEIEQL